MRRLWLCLLLLGCLGCPPQAPQEIGPDTPDLSPGQVAQGFAEHLLNHPDLDQALRWCQPSATLEVRSQYGLTAGRKVYDYGIGPASKEDNRWQVVLPIRKLTVGSSTYRGQLRLDLGEDGRRVVHSSLKLSRSDGVELNL